MKKKKVKIWKIILLVIVLLAVVGCAGFVLRIKGRQRKEDRAKAAAPGNAAEYSLDNVTPLENSPIAGKKILFLGSSVTYGAAAQGCSFADYIGRLDQVEIVKEAVSATTLVDEFSLFAWIRNGDGRSFVTRLKKVDTSIPFDAVVVQLSTNDATMRKTLGEISESSDRKDFDVHTVTGATEYIISYCKDTWNCPVIFYTGTYFKNQAYAAMADRLHELEDKWGIVIADLYNDEELNDIDPELYKLYMYDSIHPTKAGYLKWWTPEIQKVLYETLQ